MPLPFHIVTFGDSTTALRQGITVYTDLLQQAAGERGYPIALHNAGRRGDTTTMASTRLEEDVLRQKPHAVIMQFGINDSAMDVWKNPPCFTPRVSLDDFTANLRMFIESLEKQSAQVALMTPNPIAWRPKLLSLYGHPPYNPQDPRGMTAGLLPFADQVRQLASQYHLPLVDITAAYLALPEAQAFAFEELLPDGMHPGDAGHQLVAKLLWPVVESWLIAHSS